MPSRIWKVVAFQLRAGRRAEFERVVRRFVARVEEREPGTVRYEWFVSEDGERCRIVEEYADEPALLAHLDNIRDLYPELFAVADVTSIEVLGAVTETVKEAHLPGTTFGVHLDGLGRD
jgi:quinol monooxygenase YgiN